MTKLYKSEVWLRKRLYIDHKTVDQIAAECSTSRVTIYKWCKQFGLKT